MTTPDHIIDPAAIGKLRAAGFAVVPRNATAAIVNAGDGPHRPNRRSAEDDERLRR